MIDHIGITVADFARAKAFYNAVLPTINAAHVMEPVEGVACGFGRDGIPTFWITQCPGAGSGVGSATHVAFTVSSKELVDAFYDAAIKAGAKDNGAPGLRPHYHPGYYGAFVIDLDGHKIEAVCHTAKA